MEQKHLPLPVFKALEPTPALLKPLTAEVVLNVLDTLDGFVGINDGSGSGDALDGGHLVEETGGHILVNCPALVSVVSLLRVEGEDPALFLPGK